MKRTGSIPLILLACAVQASAAKPPLMPPLMPPDILLDAACEEDGPGFLVREENSQDTPDASPELLEADAAQTSELSTVLAPADIGSDDKKAAKPAKAQRKTWKLGRRRKAGPKLPQDMASKTAEQAAQEDADCRKRLGEFYLRRGGSVMAVVAPDHEGVTPEEVTYLFQAGEGKKLAALTGSDVQQQSARADLFFDGTKVKTVAEVKKAEKRRIRQAKRERKAYEKAKRNIAKVLPKNERAEFLLPASPPETSEPEPSPDPSPTPAPARPAPEDDDSAGSMQSRPAASARPSEDSSASRQPDPPPRRRPASVSEVPEPAWLDKGGSPFLQRFKKFVGNALSVVSRYAWGGGAGRNDRKHAPALVTVHHTDGHPRTLFSDSVEEMRGYRAYHMNERGWADIGYHFVIDGAGRVLEGVHSDIVASHTLNNNTNNLGVAVMGNFEPGHDKLNDKQKVSLQGLISYIAFDYGMNTQERCDYKRQGKKRSGYCFVRPHMHFKPTDCPGADIMDYLDELGGAVALKTEAIRTNKDAVMVLAMVQPH